MTCAWDAYINLLPCWLRDDVNRLGRDNLQELRLRIGRPPELQLCGKSICVPGIVRADDLLFVINIASRYSPWTAGSAVNGYITAQGGHRIGICGRICDKAAEIPSPTSLSIRVARDITGIAGRIADLTGSTLIIGKPGTGKTTLLRDALRTRSDSYEGAVTVVDDRGELFPVIRNEFAFYPGKRTDVLSGYPKCVGIEMLLKTMNPKIIGVDEITSQEDCRTLMRAGWCGVSIWSTAHASDRDELFHRPVYMPLLQKGLFQNLIILREDKSWICERM